MKRFKQVVSQRLPDCIVLENIHDPHNALAALRNCDAFGIQTVHFIFETEKIFNPKALGKATSSSANKWLDIICWKRSVDCFKKLKSQEYNLIATIIDAKAKKIEQVDFSKQKIAIIFGNEGFGISETAKQMADSLIYIPMQGFVDSLNLSVSVGIFLYELNRQRKRTGKGSLSMAQQKKIMNQWISEEQKRKLRL